VHRLRQRRLTDSVVQLVPKLREAERNSFTKDQATFADAVSRSLQHPTTAALSGWEPLQRTRKGAAETVAGHPDRRESMGRLAQPVAANSCVKLAAAAKSPNPYHVFRTPISH
jgi:hypothetical protein